MCSGNLSRRITIVSSFENLRIVDNFYQTSLFFPMPTVLKGCVAWAKENNVELVTAEHMKIINDKRSKEKSRK